MGSLSICSKTRFPSTPGFLRKVSIIIHEGEPLLAGEPLPELFSPSQQIVLVDSNGN